LFREEKFLPVETPCIRQAGFRDFDTVAASVPGCSIVATPLRPGVFSAEAAELRLGDMVLQAWRSTP
jgi:hypothetical protein